MGRVFAIFILLIGISINQLKGQACCTGGNLGAGNLQSVILEPGEISLLVGTGFTNYNRLYNGSDRIYPLDRKRDLLITSLSASFGINKKWTMSIQQDYPIQREFVQSTSEKSSLVVNGIGDLSLLVNYRVLAKGKNKVILSTGLSLPTGQNRLTDKADGIVYTPTLQPGKGTWNALFVGQYEHLKLYRPASSLFVRTTANIPITKFHPANSLPYQPGKVIAFAVGVQDRFFYKIFFEPFIYTNFKYTWEDQINDQPTLNSGGNWLSLNLGVQLLLSKNWRVRFNSSVPITQNLKGVQLSESSSYELLIGYKFKVKS